MSERGHTHGANAHAKPRSAALLPGTLLAVDAVPGVTCAHHGLWTDRNAALIR